MADRALSSPTDNPSNKEINTMDTILERKLRSDDLLPQDDETVKLYMEVYFGAEAVPLPSFRFLHHLLRFAFSQTEDDIHKIPEFDPTQPLTELPK